VGEPLRFPQLSETACVGRHVRLVSTPIGEEEATWHHSMHASPRHERAQNRPAGLYRLGDRPTDFLLHTKRELEDLECAVGVASPLQEPTELPIRRDQMP